MNKKFLLIFILLLSTNLIFSQYENPKIRQGNRYYQKKNYSKAEEHYSIATKINPKSSIAVFNFGNSQYKQKNYSGGLERYLSLESKVKNLDTLSKIQYNIGNVYVKIAEDSIRAQNLNGAIENLKKAVEYYKKAIKNNLTDQEAKHNLYEAVKMIKLLQQQQQNQQKQRQQQNQNKQKQNKDKDNNQQQKQNEPKEKQKQNNQPQNQPQLSKEEIERLLNAVKQADLKNQQKVQTNTLRNVKIREKNW